MNVEWTEDAYDRLADIAVTLSLSDQHDLERAVSSINAQLAVNALALGESRGSVRRRVWFAAPLVVQYDALSDPPRVVVFHVARLRSPSHGDGEN